MRNSHTDNNIREAEEKALHGGAGISLQPMEDHPGEVTHAVVHGDIPCCSRWICCQGNAAYEEPTLEKEISVSRKE